MNNTLTKQEGRQRRHKRIRARVKGSAACPRLAVYKSNRYLEAQLIDDEAGMTLASGKMDDATKLGAHIAKLAKDKGITKAVFDRGGFRYTGAVAALAQAARDAGLQF